MNAIPNQTFRRLPYYYNILKTLRASGQTTVSAPAIAREMNLNEVQVRKDLAAVSEQGGKPRRGFIIEDLLTSMERTLGYQSVSDAVLVGAGQLGRALLSYTGFEQNGVRLVAAFDQSRDLYGASFGGKTVYPVRDLYAYCRKNEIKIGVITVPALRAQMVCDALIGAGISAIWNFAPVHLSAPPNILVQNENMAVSLALLSQHLRQRS